MTFDRRTGWLLVMPAALVTVVFFGAPLVYFLRFSVERPSRTAFSEPVFTRENFASNEPCCLTPRPARLRWGSRPALISATTSCVVV